MTRAPFTQEEKDLIRELCWKSVENNTPIDYEELASEFRSTYQTIKRMCLLMGFTQRGRVPFVRPRRDECYMCKVREELSSGMTCEYCGSHIIFYPCPVCGYTGEAGTWHEIS